MDLGQKWLNYYWSGSSQELWGPNLLAGALSTSLMLLFLLHLSGWFAEVSTQYHSIAFELSFGVVPTALALLSYCFVVSPAAVLSKPAAILSVLNTLAYVGILTCYDGCFSHVGLVPAGAITVSIILLLANFGPEVVSKVLTRIAILLIIPFLVLGVSLRVLAIRIVATLMTINHGKSNFVSNWNELITRTDILTKPEIVPGLEATHDLDIHMWRKRTRKGNPVSIRLVGAGFSLLYLPSIFYRLILKASVTCYLPLLWVSSPPNRLLGDDGKQLLWDKSFGKTPLEKVAFVTAAAGSALFIYTGWNHDEYVKASLWSNETGWPNLYPMVLTGLDTAKIQTWHWLTGANAMITVVVLIWAWQISWKSETRSVQPSQLAILLISKLNSLKNVLSLIVLLIGLTSLLMYYHSKCQLPEIMYKFTNNFLMTECSS